MRTRTSPSFRDVLLRAARGDGGRRPSAREQFVRALRDGLAQVAEGPQRDIEHRRGFDGNPRRYAREVFGYRLMPQQERVLEMLEEHDRHAVPSAHNVGKTFILGLWAVYVVDVKGALPDEDGKEQGGYVLLLGPTEGSVYATVYSAMLNHARRAEERGFAMPGRRSEASVLWTVRPDWRVEALCPPKSNSQGIAHSISGRHHRNQVAIIEEARGVTSAVLTAVDGLCSTDGNKIVALYQPEVAAGPIWTRYSSGEYRVHHLSAMDHPNVRERRSVVAAAVGFRAIDEKVRQCEDRGAWPEVQPDPARNEFLYALPPEGAAERGARADDVPGHPDGEVRTYRPRGLFEPQVLGRYPSESTSRLFDPARLQAAVDRWRAGHEPVRAPDRIGVDVALEGDDRTFAAPCWGGDAAAVLRAYRAATQGRDVETLQRLATERVRVGSPVPVPPGRGPEVAGAVAKLFGRSPFLAGSPTWVVDDGGPGTTVVDHARSVLGADVNPVSFGAAAPARLEEEVYCADVRTALHVRTAMLVDRDLVDLPDDEELREELLILELVPCDLRAEDGRQVTGYRLLSKDRIREVLGRSPDKADAVVLSLWGERRRRGWRYASVA